MIILVGSFRGQSDSLLKGAVFLGRSRPYGHERFGESVGGKNIRIRWSCRGRLDLTSKTCLWDQRNDSQQRRDRGKRNEIVRFQDFEHISNLLGFVIRASRGTRELIACSAFNKDVQSASTGFGDVLV